jgi:hypothetical protein
MSSQRINRGFRRVAAFLVVLTLSLTGGTVAGSSPPATGLDPQVDAAISEQLKEQGDFNETLRAFHKCIVEQAKLGRLETVGILAIFSPGEACEEVANFLYRECMKVQNDEKKCSVVVVQTALHANRHYKSY